MLDLETFSTLWEDLKPELAKLKDEATELRESVGEPDINETPSDLHERLIRQRRAQDRLEAIVADLGSVLSRCQILVSDLENVYEDQWRDTMQKTRIGEYTSAKERDATFAAGSIQQLINLRKAKRFAADVEEVYTYVKFKYYGLDKARRDTEARIKLLSFESHLES